MSDISDEIDYIIDSLIRRKAFNEQQPPTHHLYHHFNIPLQGPLLHPFC